MKANKNKKPMFPVVMVILDGWGVARINSGNAISLARTPILNAFYHKYPSATLDASNSAVGLHHGQVGNSEAGHLNIGAGRVVRQDILDISDQIDDGRFFNNPILQEITDHKRLNPKAKIHVMGLLTGEHSGHTHPTHLYALLDFFARQNVQDIFLHLFTDGRDSGRYDGVRLVEKLMRNFKNGETISTIMGRYYAMDRARNWKRTKTAYELLVGGKGVAADNPIRALTNMYGLGFSDEMMPPVVVNNPKKPPAFIDDGDIVIFFNCRSDRARQLAKPFVSKEFEKKSGFRRIKKLKDLFFVSFTDFGRNLDHIHNIFPHRILENTLPCAMADNGISQVYIAETEKYAQVTYFLNGGSGRARCGESRIRIAGKKVQSFDLAPQMSTPEVTDRILKLIDEGKYEFITTNFPNADMLGHTGNLEAAIEGIETIDKSLGRLHRKLSKLGGTLVLVADHGNAESMRTSKFLAETRHNSNPVPFFIIHKTMKGRFNVLKNRGKLADAVPTLLAFLKLQKPKEMTGRSLLKL